MLSRSVRAKHKCIYLLKRSFYDYRTKCDTIFAPATSINLARGSPLGVIRVSGGQTKQIINLFTKLRVLELDEKKDLDLFSKQNAILRARHARLTKIFRPETDELLDIGLILWFPKPNSYTGEDVCEFHVHGSQAVMKSVLDSLGSIVGLRPAEAGEFTRRAVVNGKMSLIQAESLPDLIASKTDNQRRLALRGLDGFTLNKYSVWIESLISILAHLEASIDFGEDELIGEEEVVGNCIQKLEQMTREVDEFIEVSAKSREVIQSGVKATILGKPNSGKSTFMNILCRRDRSIVSDLSGTTRDVVEHTFELDGHAITLCDTAGLKNIGRAAPQSKTETTLLEKHESIEHEGIERALKAAQVANLIFYLYDGTNYSGGQEDKLDIAKELENVLISLGDNDNPKVLYLVINKMDLNNRLTEDDSRSLSEYLKEYKFDRTVEITTVFVSCKNKTNLNNLLKQLSTFLNKISRTHVETTTCGAELSLVVQQHGSQQLDYVNERHLSLLKSAHRHLYDASELNMTNIDKMAQHVREAMDYLSRIVGSVSNDEVLDVVFRDFCIGK